MEKSQTFTNKWMDNQVVIYLCNGVLLSNQRKQTMDTYNTMEESQNNYAERKIARQKASIPHIKFQEMQTNLS